MNRENQATDFTHGWISVVFRALSRLRLIRIFEKLILFWHSKDSFKNCDFLNLNSRKKLDF